MISSNSIRSIIRDQETREETYYEKLWLQASLGFRILSPTYVAISPRTALANLLRMSFPNGMSGKRALDIGCGNGRNSFLLANKGMKVIAIDIAPSAVRLAKSMKRKRYPSSQIRFLKKSFFTMPTMREKFDLILDDGFFHHIVPSLHPTYADKIARLSNDKSILILIGFSRNRQNLEMIRERTLAGEAHFTQPVSKRTIESVFRKTHNISKIVMLIDRERKKFEAYILEHKSYLSEFQK